MSPAKNRAMKAVVVGVLLKHLNKKKKTLKSGLDHDSGSGNLVVVAVVAVVVVVVVAKAK
jgi:hypothetical protein